MLVATFLIIAVKVILGFSALIMIHEFGHFIIAKISGVWVEEFGLGLPPRIIGKKFGNTIYSLNALPIGGFVKLHGETSSDQVVHPELAYNNKKPLTKIAITLAGIVMNFILAIACFAIVYSFWGIPGKIDIQIIKVSTNSPAAQSGIMGGDIIKKVDGKSVVDDIEFVNEISKFKGKSVSLEILRDNKIVELNVTPRLSPPAGEGALGVEFKGNQEIIWPPVWQRPFVGAWYGLKQTFVLSKAVILGLGGAAQSVSQGKAPKSVVGPVGIIGLFIEFAKLGLLPLINLIGIISVNLAIINIIPFPPLDGSRVALTFIEWVTKRKLTAKIEEKVYLVGFIVLIGLMILVTAREIPAVFKSGSLSKYVNSVLNQK
jgi:regulator of sigma E protease